jgi:MFS family permease
VYDLFVFATASALVFNKVFFPSFVPLIGTLLAFGTFASAYLARIVGAALFGHFGDRLGRKSMLLVSLVTMGIATFAIGLLPNYASIGMWAPVLLLTHAETREQLVELDAALAAAERRHGREEGATEIVPTVESAKGMVALDALLSASTRIRCCMLAVEDLAANLGARRTPGAEELGMRAAAS